ncbi:LLM class F420-dependent oxidoreductase, partial [Actinomadura adrarensis]
MEFGVHLGAVNPKLWPAVAEEADRLGFESLWIPEHLVVPIDADGSPHQGSDHPPIPSDVPVFDALGMLCHLAA